ncbi:MAG: hypothetical protein JNL04_09350 [Rhodospirillaceae bacterium]|nr:hypothetical protein [Rhodospirillaceae bacterium]
MLPRTLATLLGAVALALSVASVAAAQQSPTVPQPVKPTMPYKPSAQSTQKQPPGKSCIQFMLNSQAHKECVAKQAKAAEQKADQAAKKAKKKS